MRSPAQFAEVASRLRVDESTFLNATFCWGNPPAGYLDIEARTKLIPLRGIGAEVAIARLGADPAVVSVAAVALPVPTCDARVP